MNMPMTTTSPVTPTPIPAAPRGNRALRFFGWTLLAAIVVGALAIAAVVSIVGNLGPGFIQLNGQPLEFGNLDASEWIVGIGVLLSAIAVVLFVVLLVVPLAVLIPVGVALFVIAIALVAVAGAAVLAFSPLIMLVGGIWLIVRLLRGNARKRSEARAAMSGTGTGTNHGATIAG